MCAAKSPFFLFGILCSVIVGIDDVRTTDIVGSKFLCGHFGEYYVIVVLCS
jgi:hypothetical protein